jgi:hypothetical protein
VPSPITASVIEVESVESFEQSEVGKLSALLHHVLHNMLNTELHIMLNIVLNLTLHSNMFVCVVKVMKMKNLRQQHSEMNCWQTRTMT